MKESILLECQTCRKKELSSAPVFSYWTKGFIGSAHQVVFTVGTCNHCVNTFCKEHGILKEEYGLYQLVKKQHCEIADQNNRPELKEQSHKYSIGYVRKAKIITDSFKTVSECMRELEGLHDRWYLSIAGKPYEHKKGGNIKNILKNI